MFPFPGLGVNTSTINFADILEHSGKTTFGLPFTEAFTPHERLIIASKIFVKGVTVAAILNWTWRVQV